MKVFEYVSMIIYRRVFVYFLYKEKILIRLNMFIYFLIFLYVKFVYVNPYITNKPHIDLITNVFLPKNVMYRNKLILFNIIIKIYKIKIHLNIV